MSSISSSSRLSLDGMCITGTLAGVFPVESKHKGDFPRLLVPADVPKKLAAPRGVCRGAMCDLSMEEAEESFEALEGVGEGLLLLLLFPLL